MKNLWCKSQRMECRGVWEEESVAGREAGKTIRPFASIGGKLKGGKNRRGDGKNEP